MFYSKSVLKKLNLQQVKIVRCLSQIFFCNYVGQVVFEYSNDRPIIFSTFQPDAAQLIRKLQSIYPVSRSCIPSSCTYLSREKDGKYTSVSHINGK